MHFKFKSIKTRYQFAGLLICLVTIGFSAIATYAVAFSMVSKEINKQYQLDTDKNASHLNTWFLNFWNLVECSSPDLTFSNQFESKNLLTYFKKRLAKYPEVLDFYIGTTEDKIISGTGWVPPPEFSTITRPWYLASMKDSNAVFTPPYFDWDSKGFIITVSKPVYQSEKLFGVLAADVTIQNIIKAVNSYAIGKSTYAFLLDNSGNIVSHPNKSYMVNDSGLTNIHTLSYYEEIAKGVDNQDLKLSKHIVKDYDGVNRYITLSRVTSSGWILGIAMDESEYSRPLRSLLYGFAIAFILAMLASIVIMRRMIKGMALPIQQLHSAVDSFSFGKNENRIIVHSSDEIGKLAKSFNEMADLIQKTNHSLELKVEDRTTELSKANKTLNEINNELTELKNDLLNQVELQTSRLVEAEKRASIGTLAAGVAHEIGNPVHFMLINTRVLQKGWEYLEPLLKNIPNESRIIGTVSAESLIQEIPDLLSEMVKGCHRIERIVNDLKEFATPYDDEFTTIDLNEVVERTLRLSRAYIKSHTNNLEICSTETPILVHGNIHKLEQVLINLLQNSCRALTSKDQTIKIEMTNDPHPLIRVIDNGNGMSESTLASIGNPFFTMHRTEGGTGLGISVAHRIVATHHAHLRFESSEDHGTIATVEFPHQRKENS